MEKGIPPKCSCGCGQEVTWSRQRARWNKFVHRHYVKKDRGIPPKCACGCGQEVVWRWPEWNKFVYRHHAKGPDWKSTHSAFYDIARGPERTVKMIKGVKAAHKRGAYDHVDAEERNRKVSEAVKASWADPNSNQMIGVRKRAQAQVGKKHTIEQRRTRSEATRKQWAQGKRSIPDGAGYGHNHVYQSPSGSVMLRSNIELRFAELLDEYWSIWEYESRRFPLSKGSYCPDFYIPEIDRYFEIKGMITDEWKRKFLLMQTEYSGVDCVVVYERDFAALTSASAFSVAGGKLA